MGIRKSAFASRSERENYYKLSRSWGDKFKIYHNLPFLNVFTTDDLPDIDSYEVNRLKKTSIDFVLCNDLDEFVLGVDFDGWLQGVNTGTQYHPSRTPENSWRKEITELKLYVAHSSNFPYFIFSSKEFNDIGESIPLTLADGIIGDVIANKIARERQAKLKTPRGLELNEGEAALLDSVKEMGPVDWNLLLQVQAEVTHNPIVKLKWEMWGQLGNPSSQSIIVGAPTPIHTLSGNHPWAKYKTIFPQGLPSGNTVLLKTDDCGIIWANVCLHEFKTPDYSGFWLGDDIAFLLALDKLRRERTRKRQYE